MKKLAILTLVIVCVRGEISKAGADSSWSLTLDFEIIKNYCMSLFQEGSDHSKVEQTFAGPVCAKGRVTPEFEDFFDGTGIILQPLYPGIGSVGYDPRKIEGIQSTKLNVGGEGESYFTYYPSPPFDWKHKSIKFRFYIPPTDHNIKQVDIRLRSVGTQCIYSVWHVNHNSPRVGWIEYAFTPTQGYNLGDVAAVDRIMVGVVRQNAEQPAYVLVNSLTVWDGRLKMPLYCCTFDDNYVRQYEAAMYALSRGIPISLFINKNCSDGVGVNGTEGMTLAQNQALAKAGCVHINHGVSHSPPKDRGDGVRDLWSNPETPVADLIADLEENRQWMDENGLGFGAGIFGAPQEWWLPHHEEHLLSYIWGRPRQGHGMGHYGLLTMWDENTEIHAGNDTYLEHAYIMLENNVGTLLWTPGTYPTGTLREWTDGKIYEVTNPSGTSEDPSGADWIYIRDRGPEDEGDRAIHIEVWHQYESNPNEGCLQDFKDYIDVVAAHMAAGRLRAVDLRQLYENYLYSAKPPDTVLGDLYVDGIVNLKDLLILSQNWLIGIEE